MTEQTRARQQSATIYAVADLAQVSIATVSRVLQGSSVVTEKTRLKVLAAVEELDYLPSGAARSLAVRQHDTFGLVLPEMSGPYYADLLVGFETRAAELGQSVMLVLAGAKGDGGKAVRTLATRVDGIAVMGTDTSHLGASSKPIVVVAGDARPGFEVITTENTDSARRLTDHLLGDHGRTRLLFVGDPDAAHDVLERHAGFVAAHEARGLVPAPPVLAPFREAEGTAVADRIIAGELDHRRPRLQQRRAGARDHRAPRRLGGRRPRRHRGRRLGRRDDGPLRPARPHHRPPARAGGRGHGRRPAPRTSCPAPPRAPGATSCPPRSSSAARAGAPARRPRRPRHAPDRLHLQSAPPRK